jgi:phosphatidylglycerophosphate synthase
VRERKSVAGIAGLDNSRAATNALLDVLRQGRWRPAACTRFLVLAGDRSARQAARHPRALAQTTCLHTVLFALAERRGRSWVAASWALTVTHLGLLEGRDRLTAADALTLCRANLPALAAGRSRWAGVAALASDISDGRLARSTGTASAFGAYADTFADAVFWPVMVLRHEPDRRWRVSALAVWAAPVVGVAALSVVRAKMIESPRPVLLRPAAAMQAIIALRRLRSL